MKLVRLAAALTLAAASAGCDLAARTGVIRNDMAVLSNAQEVIANIKINHGDMTIQGSVDRADTTYNVGQPIVLSVSTSKDAHVAILRVLPNGDTTLLFPVKPKPEADTANAKADKTDAKAGKADAKADKANPKPDVAANEVLTVPGPHDHFAIAADKPGVALFEFIASTAGDSWLFKRAPDKDADFADLGVTTRAIAKDILTSLKIGSSSADTAATYVTVRVK